MYMSKKLSDIIEEAKKVWDSLPKEVKVSVYLALSYSIEEAAKQLGLIESSNIFVVFGINLALVFLKELKSRIVALIEKIREVVK